MLNWIAYALRNLTIDEFERVIRRAEELFKAPSKILLVTRTETKTRVTVQTAAGDRKLIVI